MTRSQLSSGKHARLVVALASAVMLVSSMLGSPARTVAATTEHVTNTPGVAADAASLPALISASDRTGIQAWAKPLSIVDINAAVAALTEPNRQALASVLLDTAGSGTAAERARLLQLMQEVLDNPLVGFYAEIWSYTQISLTGTGFLGGCNHVYLTPGSFDGLSDNDALAVLMHESMHSFNCVNNGPSGALNEGSAIWVSQAAFPEKYPTRTSWAETTYGTELWYREVRSPSQPDYPLGWVSSAATQKLLDVYSWLASTDPSRLPWDDAQRLATCFQTYWAALPRDSDFNTVWVPAEQQATQKMLADSACQPLPEPVFTPPTGTVTLASAIAPGVVRSGGSFRTSSLVVPYGTYATFRFTAPQGVLPAGTPVVIWYMTRATETSTFWQKLTVRLLGADGTARLFLRIRGWIAIRGYVSGPAGSAWSLARIATARAP